MDATDGELTLANRTFNVLYILGYGNVAWPVSDELVGSIRSRLGSRGRRSQTRQFRNGDAVMISHGPFKGFEAVFDGYLSAAGRVQVLITTLQSAYRAELDADKLSGIGQSAKSAAA